MKTYHKVLLCASCASELRGSNSIKYQLDNIKPGEIRGINEVADLLILGVGIFQSEYRLARAIMDGGYGLVVSAGIAGAYNGSISLGDTFMVSSSAFADCATESTSGGMCPVVGSDFLGADDYPFRNGRIENPISRQLASSLGIGCAAANTVNRIRTSPAEIAEILRLHPADLETMESAALAYACAMEGIGYAEARSVSNHTVPKSQQKWAFAQATGNLGAVIDKILDNNCKLLKEYLAQSAKKTILAP